MSIRHTQFYSTCQWHVTKPYTNRNVMQRFKMNKERKKVLTVLTAGISIFRFLHCRHRIARAYFENIGGISLSLKDSYYKNCTASA